MGSNGSVVWLKIILSVLLFFSFFLNDRLFLRKRRGKLRWLLRTATLLLLLFTFHVDRRAEPISETAQSFFVGRLFDSSGLRLGLDLQPGSALGRLVFVSLKGALRVGSLEVSYELGLDGFDLFVECANALLFFRQRFVGFGRGLPYILSARRSLQPIRKIDRQGPAVDAK